MRKVVDEFLEGDTFLGDFYNYTMFEKNGNEAPYFYKVFGPYDTISKKAPQQAVVFEAGKVVLNIDYTKYADIRTGTMDSFILQLCRVESLQNKKVLLLGVGGTARSSITSLKQIFPDFISLDYLNSTSTKNEEFEQFCDSMELKAQVGSLDNLHEYDFIFMHTNTKKLILDRKDIDRIKPGCIITIYIATPDSLEVADEFYSENANVILDWEKNYSKCLEMQRMVEKNILKKQSILLLKDLISGERKLADKQYTIFRSLGTPMQNLAVLKILMEEAIQNIQG